MYSILNLHFLCVGVSVSVTERSAREREERDRATQSQTRQHDELLVFVESPPTSFVIMSQCCMETIGIALEISPKPLQYKYVNAPTTMQIKR